VREYVLYVGVAARRPDRRFRGNPLPYKAQKRGSKWVVVNKHSGKVMGTHDSEKKAQAQVRALYANEPELRRRS